MVSIADDLIAGKRASYIPPPSKEALVELAKLCEYNDAHHGHQRVGAEAAIAMLRSMGWTGKGRTALDRACVDGLGRKSWGTP